MKRLDCWGWDVAPEFISSAMGGGKFVSDIAPRICTYMGSQMWVSVKPELADFGLGRCADTSPQFAEELALAGLHPGVDPKGITGVRYFKPRFRAVLHDPHRQSFYGAAGLDCSYTFLSEIPKDDPDTAIPRTKAFCRGLIDSNRNGSDNDFFRVASLATTFSCIGHALTRFPPELQHLPAVVDFARGMDPRTGGSSKEQFLTNLESMTKNPAWGGIISWAASRLLQAGDRTYGSVVYELGNNLDFLLSPAMRRHLSGPSQFSYEEMGNDDFPVAQFIIPSRDDLDTARRYMRMHVAMFIAVMKTKLKRPRLPVLACFDEARQYIGPEAAEASMVLRDNRVKQVQYWQSPFSAEATLGEGPFNEYKAQATIRVYGVREIVDAEWVSRVLGVRMGIDGNALPLADPQTVLRELAIRSNLQYVLPFAGPPVWRVHRRAFKSLRTPEGCRFRGLPLKGHYDEGLSRYS